MAKHLEDFLDLSCDELKFYLRQRAIPVGGKHSDLAARALVAFEQNTPVKESEVACYWNSSSKKEVEPQRVKDMNIQAHKLNKSAPQFSLNSMSKQEFDPRPLGMRDVSDEKKQSFLTSVPTALPSAVLNISYAPPTEEDVPPSLQEIADKVLTVSTSKEESELVSSFSQMLSFNDNSLKELEKATRGQSKSYIWIQQRIGRITASNFHDIYNKVKKLLRQRGKAVKSKVTPLLVKLMNHKDLGHIPAIRWGRMHEKDASKAFFTTIAKLHTNPKLHICGLFVLKSHPYIGASPDNIFSCSCCQNSCLEYKCPFSIKDVTVEEGYKKTDFLENCDGKLQLKRNHKYFFQVQGQMALTGLETTYFVIWTMKGQPLVEKIAFDLNFWQDIL
eukprot:gene16402-18039_t